MISSDTLATKTSSTKTLFSFDEDHCDEDGFVKCDENHFDEYHFCLSTKTSSTKMVSLETNATKTILSFDEENFDEDNFVEEKL